MNGLVHKCSAKLLTVAIYPGSTAFRESSAGGVAQGFSVRSREVPPPFLGQVFFAARFCQQRSTHKVGIHRVFLNH